MSCRSLKSFSNRRKNAAYVVFGLVLFVRQLGLAGQLLQRSQRSVSLGTWSWSLQVWCFSSLGSQLLSMVFGFLCLGNNCPAIPSMPFPRSCSTQILRVLTRPRKLSLRPMSWVPELVLLFRQSPITPLIT